MTGSVVTDRDLRLVLFAARFGFLTVAQAQHWMGHIEGGSDARRVTNRRLQALLRAGLLDSDHMLSAHGRIVWVTHEGLRACGLTGQVRPPRIGSAIHDKLVTDLCIQLMIEKPHHELVTEREMRRLDTPNQHLQQQPAYVTIYPGSRSRRVYPDALTIAPSGGRVIHEVELTPKAVDRLVVLMTSHLSNQSIGGLRYYAAPAAFSAVTAAAERAQQLGRSRGQLQPITVVALEPSK